ncbi:MAG: D-aminoacylase [Candidatus Sungbacteria bacterium]|nr:D-aminoacylase [Candidatus Sungbacteria bacterium]
MLDLIIRDGTIIDGTGRAGFSADVGVKDGLISEIRNLNEVKAEKIIEAGGRYVTPGFIDITNHSDVTAAIFQAPLMENLMRQGITTIIGGNCGVSLAPLTDPDVIHGIRKWVQTSSINVNWLTVGEYLAQIESLGIGINFGTLVGHGTIRRGVTHDAVRPLKLEELAKVKLMLQDAIRQGALGFSTNLASSHELHATTEELIEMARVLATEGGVYKTHLRDEGANLISAVNEALRIGAEAGAPVIISHLKAIGRQSWPLMKRAVKMIETDSKSGHKVMFDISPYRTTGSQLYMLLPAWAREGGFSAMLPRLRDATLRPRIVADLKALSLHFGKFWVSEAEDGLSTGKTLEALAEKMGTDPHETVLELLIANRGRVSIIGKTLHPKNVEIGIKSAFSMVASNGSAYDMAAIPLDFPHPRSFGSFPHFLHVYTRDKQILSWEDAVMKITSAPAEAMRIKNRGKILKNYAADMVVLNPDTICDEATYKNPFRVPEGIDAVVVNGGVALEKGQTAGIRKGKIIRNS